MAYNEVDTLERTCGEVRAALDDLRVPAEVLVIDDGSTDGTGEKADAIATYDGRFRVIHHGQNQGLGGVYRTGFREARGDFVTFIPADGQLPASIVAQFLPLMADQDLVLGYLPRRTRSIVAEVLSTGERILYRILLGSVPRFQGVLMFRRALLGVHELRSDGRGWGVLMEFIIRCARGKQRMISVPTVVRPRTHGTSKVNNLRTIWSNLGQLIELRTILRNEAPSRSSVSGR